MAPQTSVTSEPLAATIPGLIGDIQPRSVRSMRSEISAQTAYGLAVKKGTADDQFKLPAAAGDDIIGILAHTHFISTLGVGARTAPVALTDVANVLTRGAVYVLVEQDVTPADPVYVRFANGVADATKTQKGAFRKNEDTATARLLRGARFMTSASAGDLALLEFDSLAEHASAQVLTQDETLESDLASVANGAGASKIGIEDAASKITGTTVETALAELALAKSKLALTTNGNGASLIGIEDALTLLAGTTVEAALAELAKYIPIELTDPGTGVAIPVTRSATVPIVTAGAETNTLAVPSFIGQRMILTCKTRSVGNRVVTAAAAINVANNTIMTFSADSQTIELQAVRATGGTLVWAVLANDGVGLT